MDEGDEDTATDAQTPTTMGGDVESGRVGGGVGGMGRGGGGPTLLAVPQPPIRSNLLAVATDAANKDAKNKNIKVRAEEHFSMAGTIDLD